MDESYFDLGQVIGKRIEPFPYLPENAQANLSANAIQQYIDSLKVEYTASTNAGSWIITTRAYGWLRWHNHLAKAYPLPARKLRKCHLRKRTKRMQRARRRYV